MDDATIKGNILRKRTELRLSQKEMAARLDISLNAYRKIESGKTRIINEHVQAFAERTGTSLSSLVLGFDPVDPQEVQSLEVLREEFRKQALAQQAPLLEELDRLRAENARLREKVADKEAVIKSDQKLIRRYEKELSEHAK